MTYRQNNSTPCHPLPRPCRNLQMANEEHLAGSIAASLFPMQRQLLRETGVVSPACPGIAPRAPCCLPAAAQRTPAAQGVGSRGGGRACPCCRSLWWWWWW